MKIKRIMAAVMTMAMVAGVSTTSAFAYSNEAPDGYYGMMVGGYDGTWSSIARSTHPGLPAPSGWAAEQVYYAAGNGIFYAPDYNKSTGTMGPTYISWQSPMTRDNFGDTLMAMHNQISAIINQQLMDHQIKSEDRQLLTSYHSKNWIVSQKFDTSLYKISEAGVEMYNSIGQNPNMSFDEYYAKCQEYYNNYLSTGGKLSMVDWNKFIFAFDPTFDPENFDRAANFTDISSWTVESLCAGGWMTGVSETQFNPNGVMTREDGAMAVYRVLSSLGVPMTKSSTVLADDSMISANAKEAVYVVMGMKDANGNPLMPNVNNNTFNPQASMTTEEGTVLIVRMLDVIERYIEDTVK